MFIAMRSETIAEDSKNTDMCQLSVPATPPPGAKVWSQFQRPPLPGGEGMVAGRCLSNRAPASRRGCCRALESCASLLRIERSNCVFVAANPPGNGTPPYLQTTGGGGGQLVPASNDHPAVAPRSAGFEVPWTHHHHPRGGVGTGPSPSPPGGAGVAWNWNIYSLKNDKYFVRHCPRGNVHFVQSIRVSPNIPTETESS